MCLATRAPGRSPTRRGAALYTRQRPSVRGASCPGQAPQKSWRSVSTRGRSARWSRPSLAALSRLFSSQGAPQWPWQALHRHPARRGRPGGRPASLGTRRPRRRPVARAGRRPGCPDLRRVPQPPPPPCHLPPAAAPPPAPARTRAAAAHPLRPLVSRWRRGRIGCHPGLLPSALSHVSKPRVSSASDCSLPNSPRKASRRQRRSFP
mmetsp:Transcript_83884/g.259377  ORF Transcript_83884/g.259377 Transcript_83884/m.259377 type:complete len:207 (-) Transcript_83884:1446-2066(-)